MSENSNASDTTPEPQIGVQDAISPEETVGPLTIVRYLIGDKEAIRRIAGCRHILWLGFLLVLSAGFAREYDGEDLLAEPWHVFIPHAASVVTSLALYAMIRLPAVRSRVMLMRFLREYPMFLGLYWMTAPMAWLYAVPFERWLSAGDATRANLCLLAAVALWRVVLIIRVIMVIWQPKRGWPTVAAVLLFGDAVMLIAVSMLPVPVLQLMGGVRLTESEAVLQATQLLLRLIGFPTLLVLLIVYLAGLPPTPVMHSPLRIAATRPRNSLAAFCIALIVGWLCILTQTQPAQRLRHLTETALQSGRIDQALDLMSRHDPSDFPPHWSPPPQVALFDDSPSVAEVVRRIAARRDSVADWVRQVYLDKLHRVLSDAFSFYGRHDTGRQLTFLQLLSELPREDWYSPDRDLGRDLRAFLADAEASPSDYSAEFNQLVTDLISIADQTDPEETQNPTDPE